MPLCPLYHFFNLEKVRKKWKFQTPSEKITGIGLQGNQRRIAQDDTIVTRSIILQPVCKSNFTLTDSSIDNRVHEGQSTPCGNNLLGQETS